MLGPLPLNWVGHLAGIRTWGRTECGLPGPAQERIPIQCRLAGQVGKGGLKTGQSSPQDNY